MQWDILLVFPAGRKTLLKTWMLDTIFLKLMDFLFIFMKKNVHPQCTACNRFRRGNLTAYAIALRKRYGESILEELDELKHKSVKYSRSDYEELIEKYKGLLK